MRHSGVGVGINSAAGMRRLATVGVVLAALSLTWSILVPAGGVGADPAAPPVAPAPAAWPSTAGTSPEIEAWSHGLRIGGADRYSTNLALNLTLRGMGGFPFDTPDRSSGGADTLAAADGWWGLGQCPRAVIVVAGDTPADALAATTLSDPTGESSEPYLQRAAAADPLFDPPGGFARVDTDAAPILVTRSARQGATALAPPARTAAADLRAGGCTLAAQAIVVGGTSAVPEAVEDELLSLGYNEVFRVQGANRFATAAAVAQSLGTDPVPVGATCTDPSVAEGNARMDFYDNTVVELREGPDDCRLLGRTVVLAEGLTGADALAAGWWTSFWQVPVLLHDGSNTLPGATAAALEFLEVDNIVVLGGTARIPDVVVDAATDVTGADPVRIAGDDRYATSVAMARLLGGWWPTGRGHEFAGSTVCLAASSGSGAAAQGWPDALAAGPWCGTASGAAANPGTPDRALAPTLGASPTTSATMARPGHDAVPVLLVPAGAQALPASVADLLEDAFEPADVWCSSVAAPPTCHQPGFVIGVGGPTAIGEGAMAQANRLVSGGTAASGDDRTPRLDPAFFTGLDLAPVFAEGGAGTRRVCASRDSYAGLRWLAAFADEAAAEAVGVHDVMVDGRYRSDGDGVARTPGVGAPACVSVPAVPDDDVVVRGVSLSGRATPAQSFNLDASARFALTGPIAAATPDAASGLDSAIDVAPGLTTTWTYIGTGGPAVVSRGQASGVASSALTVTLTRDPAGASLAGPHEFTATWSMTTPLGAVTGTARGEALFDGTTWQLRGRSSFSGGSWNVAAGAGGFVADIHTGAAGTLDDDAIVWRADGLVTGS